MKKRNQNAKNYKRQYEKEKEEKRVRKKRNQDAKNEKRNMKKKKRGKGLGIISEPKMRKMRKEGT